MIGKRTYRFRLISFLSCFIILVLMPKKALSQDVKINIETAHLATLESVFNLIKSETNYEFIYRSDLIKNGPNVFLHKGDYKVSALLKKGLNKIDCTYEFKNNRTIIVTKKSDPTPNAPIVKTVYGKITFADQAVHNVNIRIKNTNQGTKTDEKGHYSIVVEVGDVLQYSHVSFKTMSIIVEDVTGVLNLEMESQVNTLEETIVIAKKKETRIDRISEAYDKEVVTVAGKINPMLFPSKVHYVSGEQLGSQYLSLTEALRGKFSGSLPSIFDVDGTIYYDDTFIDISRIKDIYIITGSVGTMRWGGPFIIVSTMDAPEEIKKRNEAIAERHRNQNYYQKYAKEQKSASLGKEEKGQITQSPIIKTISGTITQLDTPLEQVRIGLKYSKGGTATDAQGNYKINGEVGDVLEYEHYGYKTVAIVIEDITEVLDLEMVPKDNVLDEVLVIARTKQGKVLPHAKRAEQTFSTARGNIDPKRAGYSIDFVGGDEITGVYNSLSEALLGKIPGAQLDPVTKRLIVKPTLSINNEAYPIWDVDGAIFVTEPPLQLSTVESVNVLKTLSATNRYGSAGAGGVIVVKTKTGNFKVANANLQKITHQYTNNNYYANDAVTPSLEEQYHNPYTKILQTIGNKFTAFEHYTQNLKPEIIDYATHLDIAQSFSVFYKDSNLSTQILEQVMQTYDKNPEILKAVAYQLQAIGDTRNAVRAYKKVIQLRPNYAQSYRDLANAYKENDQFKKAWRVYMNYLMQGHDISDEGIGPLLFNEMEYLYYNRSHHTKIRERFEPKNETLLDFRNDVRLVFEWNTSEAEFDLEFVSPDQRAYVFEHTLATNQDLITDEKEKGYSSKDFIIENLIDGEWLVNITYRGNKKPEPSYLKVTKYFNWGNPNQIEITEVYKFEQMRDKIQLIKLNKQLLENH